jgi:hypothetical protein
MARMLYGAGAYAGSQPVGGGATYQSEYREALAHYVVESAAELESVLKEAKGDQLIWQAKDITCPDSSSLGTLKAILASDLTHTISQPKKASSFMTPVIYGASGSIFEGLRMKGPGSTCNTGGPRNCAIRGVEAARRIEIANCDIGYFYEGGVYFNSGGMTWNSDAADGRHWLHHCHIHHIQKHGFGYGVSEEGNCSYLLEASRVEHCRHLVMGQGGGHCSYELRYNVFGDADYLDGGSANNVWYVNHQVDFHGTPGPKYALIHHNTFSANNRNEAGKSLTAHVNVGIRGKAVNFCKVYNNWTRKTTHSGLYTETKSNSAFSCLAGGGGPVSASLSSYNITANDNWYGTTPPAGEDGSGGYDDGGSGGDFEPSGDLTTFGVAMAASVLFFMAIAPKKAPAQPIIITTEGQQK